MNKEFCTYNQALALKQLGFDEPCLAFYCLDTLQQVPSEDIADIDFNTNINSRDNSKEQYADHCTSAPLKQQVFRWFREKYGIHIRIEKYDENKWWANWGIWTSIVFDTHEEAEDACIDKLIELIKK